VKPENIETIHKMFLACPLSWSTRIYKNFSCESEENYLLALGYIEKARYARNVCSVILQTVQNS